MSQWRAYCPPEGGYNLAFNPEILKEHLDRHNFQLRQCVYDVRAQQDAIATVVDNVLPKVKELNDEKAIREETDIALKRLTSELSLLAPILKHPDFREEQEWRAFALVPSTAPRMDYHVKGSLAIPHCALDLETPTLRFPVSQVFVGPNALQDLATRGIWAIAAKAGLRLQATKSTTPLRNL